MKPYCSYLATLVLKSRFLGDGNLRLPSSKWFASLYTDFLLYLSFQNAETNHFCIYLIKKVSMKETVYIQSVFPKD